MSEEKVYAEGELLKDLQDLTEAFEAETKRMAEEQPPATLVVTDIYEQYKHLLSEKAQAGLEPYIKSTLHTPAWNVPGDGMPDESTRSVYLSVMVHQEKNISKAVEAIWKDVERLSEQGALRGHLVKLSYIKLAAYASKEEEERATKTPFLGRDENGKLRFRHDVVRPTGTAYGVFCFPHVPAEFDVSSYATSHEEGDVGPYIDEAEGA